MAKQGKTADDEFTITEKGKITLAVKGEKMVLARPTIGKMRELDEHADEMSEAQDAEIKTAKEEDRKPRSMAPEIIGWWRLAVSLLGPEGAELPEDDDDCPFWMTNTEAIRESKFAWRTVPWGPGGAPSAKAAELAAAKAAKLIPAVSEAMGLAKAAQDQ